MGLSIEALTTIEGKPFARFVAQQHPSGECREIRVVHPIYEFGMSLPVNHYYDPVANLLVRVKRLRKDGRIEMWRC
jgi:hypothetical protein